MTSSRISDLAGLEHWYETLARPLIVGHQPSRVSELDEALVRARHLSRLRQEEIAFYSIGRPGAGKGTLIDAIVAGEQRRIQQAQKIKTWFEAL